MKLTKYTRRQFCRFVIEAKTPLAVGSGLQDILTDALVAVDVNGLPYIPATSIAGVIRHNLDASEADALMGYQENDKGEGSKIIFTEARIINSQGKVVDGLKDDVFNDAVLKYYEDLPIRQHVRINAKGATDRGGKFDNQVVYAGTRFCFEIEMLMTEDDDNKCNEILGIMQGDTFRLGGGTRNGLGKIEVVELYKKELDMKSKEDMELYLSKPSELAESAQWPGWESDTMPEAEMKSLTKYKLTLTPADFVMFGSGFGDDTADMIAVKENKVEWQEGKGKVVTNMTLIPASSVKGALRHRVAYHYNRLACTRQVENDNLAVRELFGYEDQKSRKQACGNLLFSDVLLEELDSKVITHVKIDRFTGGATDGALFDEAPLYARGKTFTLEIVLLKKDEELSEFVKEALECALDDICKGMLPLGGHTNRGHGIFTGTRN